MPRDNIHHLHRGAPVTRQLTDDEREVLAKEVADIRAHVERDRFAKGFKHRHYRIGEPIPTSLSDFALGAAAGFLIGLSPFAVMLAIMVWS